MKATKAPTFSGFVGIRELHTYVDPHPGLKGTDKVPVACSRCVNRSGYIRAFAHVQGGICFRCQGTGSEHISVSTIRRWAKADAYQAEYAAEITARNEELRRIEIAENAAREFAAAWDEAHQENARRDALVQGFVGQEGDKVTVSVTIQVAKYISGSYNRSASMFIIAKTESGQVVKVFGSSQTLFDLERGDQATFTGTVKDHEVYNGQQQTVLKGVKASNHRTAYDED